MSIVETADAEGAKAFDGANLLISGNRAAILKLTNQREALPTAPVLIQGAPRISTGAVGRAVAGAVHAA